MPLLAAAVVARLPYPHARDTPDPSSADAGNPRGEDEHDRVLRRIRELGDLHRDGVLADDELAVAKQALLRRL